MMVQHGMTYGSKLNSENNKTAFLAVFFIKKKNVF